MTRTHRLDRRSGAWSEPRHAAGSVAAIVVTAVYSGFASGAAAFSAIAYLAVSVASAFVVGALVIERLRPKARPRLRMEPRRPAGASGTALPWLLVIALLVAVELAAYFHGGPRADYPTLSYGLNELFRFRAAKAGAWFLWLVVGWYLVRR